MFLFSFLSKVVLPFHVLVFVFASSTESSSDESTDSFSLLPKSVPLLSDVALNPGHNPLREFPPGELTLGETEFVSLLADALDALLLLLFPKPMFFLLRFLSVLDEMLESVFPSPPMPYF